MTDDLVAKLRRMAERGTPHEAAVARDKLLAMASRGGVPPRRPAAPPSAPAPEPDDESGGWFYDGMRDWRRMNRGATTAWTSSSTSNGSWANVTITSGGSTVNG